MNSKTKTAIITGGGSGLGLATAKKFVENDIKTILSAWEKKGATNDDLKKFKATYQSNLYNQLSTVQGKGSSLASFFTLAKNANNIKPEMQRYLQVTTQDVMRVYEKYIKNKRKWKRGRERDRVRKRDRVCVCM